MSRPCQNLPQTRKKIEKEDGKRTGERQKGEKHREIMLQSRKLLIILYVLLVIIFFERTGLKGWEVALQL